MFIPIFIAILMGLISPTNHSSNCNSGGTVYVNSTTGEDGEPSTNPGDNSGGDDTGIGGPGPANPGGGSGQNPPPKP